MIQGESKPSSPNRETYIAFLRGINVSGQKKIKMADLKQLLTLSGLSQVQTYIQSGNVVFSSDQGNREKLVLSIEKAIAEKFGFEVSVLIKTRPQLEQIVAGNPYKNPEDLASNRIYYVFLKHTPEETRIESLDREAYPNEHYKFTEECIYLACSNGYGKAKLNNNLFERKLQVIATTRNHRTLLKLLEMSLT